MRLPGSAFLSLFLLAPGGNASEQRNLSRLIESLTEEGIAHEKRIHLIGALLWDFFRTHTIE